ncbi:MAG: N-acetylmuramoyl-L-alanine amidase family protein [Oscillospiraceae bacterium]|nr:N-acetylmuramoyl-L-alanine amidase family protein [Oscillospiraceae bacterium]
MKEKQIKQKTEKSQVRFGRNRRKAAETFKDSQKHEYVNQLIEIYNKPDQEQPQQPPVVEVVEKEKLTKRIFGDVKPALERTKTVIAGLKNHSSAVIGTIALIFAIIGLIATLTVTIGAISDAFLRTKQKEFYNDYLFPLVTLDPPAYEDISKLDNRIIVSSGILDFIMNVDTSVYEKDEFGFINVPQADIDAHITKLFGEQISYIHQSVADSDFAFEYNGADKTYYVTTKLNYTPYVPRVKKISNIGANTEVLEVGYVSSGSILTKEADQQTADKVLYYAVNEYGKDKYRVIAISETQSGAIVKPQSSEIKVPQGWSTNEETGQRFYGDSEGNALIGWQQIDNNRYRFDENGAAFVDGWFEDFDGKWYYFDKDGVLAQSQWLDLDGKWYYFAGDGVMLQNQWSEIEDNWYHFGESGVMNTGWFEDFDGKWYYLGTNGVMVRNEKVDGYQLGEYGYME